MTTLRQLGRRSSAAVLVIIACAVAMLGVLLSETSRMVSGTYGQVAAQRLESLVQLEAACAILLLTALGLGIRLAIMPTQERLHATIAALEESEYRRRAVLDAMDEGMLLVSATGQMLTWNPSALRILGLGPAEGEPSLQAVARRMFDEQGTIIGPENLPSRVTIRTGRSLENVAMMLRREDGTTRWLSVNTHPLYHLDDPHPYAAVAIFRDVTAARRLEDERAAHAEALELQNRELLAQADALEHGQALYRSVVDTAVSAIIGLDVHGIVFEWNREAELLYGVPREQAIGADYVERFVAPKLHEQMRGGMASVRAGNTLRNLIAPVKTPAGERRAVLWNIAPLRTGPNDSFDGFIAAGLDITEREASDERFRLLFERSSDAHLLYDEKGIIDCNDATLRLFRYSRKESVIGRRATDLSPTRQPDGRLSIIVGEQMRQLARVRGYHRFEWVHQRADGTAFPVEITLTPVRLHGREAMLAVWHDIAEQKRVEEALRAAKDAAESANRTKSDFMTRMNHELRTPLTAIIGFSKVLMQGKHGALSPSARNYLERIRVNGMHLLSVINQILDVAKVEAGRMELEMEPVQLDALVRETLGMLESTADGKGLALRAEVPARVAPMRTDAGKLRQILINLVGNAVKFTVQGEVCVSIEVDPVTARPSALVVRDTGIGIPRERQNAVFHPFEQGDSSTRREFGGTGLGLSIVKTFAELIGATIELQSEVGRGSAFTLRFPAEARVPQERTLAGASR